MRFDNAIDAFLSLSKINDRVYNLIYSFEYNKSAKYLRNKKKFDCFYDFVFKDKTAWKKGEKVIWRRWMDLSSFPVDIWENGGRIFEILEYYRKNEIKKYGKNSEHNFFYNLCVNKFPDGKTYIEYLIKKWKDLKLRKQPLYFFNLFTSSIFSNISKNKKAFKSPQTSIACCMDVIFRWDLNEDIPHITFIFKNSIWSHLYEDTLSLCYFAWPLFEEGFSDKCLITVFTNCYLPDENNKRRIFGEYKRKN